jgi:tetratricopeptide (TPR) repeat protein
LGFAKLHAGRNDGIMENAQRALVLARRHEYRAIEAAALRLMGDACRHGDARDREAAEQHYLKACEISRELALLPELAHCQRGLAQSYVKSNRLPEADRCFEAAAKIYRDTGMIVPDEEIVGSSAINR